MLTLLCTPSCCLRAPWWLTMSLGVVLALTPWGLHSKRQLDRLHLLLLLREKWVPVPVPVQVRVLVQVLVPVLVPVLVQVQVQVQALLHR